MRLTVLGCSGTYPGPDSPCSGYLVEHDGFRLVLDLGPGALGPLQRAIGLLDVDAVYVSHLHADHCTDLVGMSYARRYHPDGMPAPLPLYGPTGLRDRLCGVFEVPPPVHRFSATGDPEPFARLGRRFLGPQIGTVTTLGAA